MLLIFIAECCYQRAYNGIVSYFVYIATVSEVKAIKIIS